MEGKVVRLVKEKNFRFIQAGGQDYFFHASGLKNISYQELKIGQEVQFEDVTTDKGLRAEDIYA